MATLDDVDGISRFVGMLAVKSLISGAFPGWTSPRDWVDLPQPPDIIEGAQMNDFASMAADHGGPSRGANSVDARARPFVDRVERIIAEMESDKGAYMARCKAARDRIKEVLTEAKDVGLPVKAVKGIVKYRGLERKQQKIATGLDVDEAAVYSALVEALGELGAAAARAAGFDFAAANSNAH